MHQKAIFTRFPSPIKQNKKNDKEKIATIAHHFEQIMETLGLDVSDPSLARTPQRVAQMYVKEVFSGLKEQDFPRMTFIENKYQTNENRNMISVKVHFTSFCEHHFVPIIGNAYVAYIPNKKLIGLSKIPRLVRFFAKRPQVQERLTAQIADSLAAVIESEDVAVSITAKHFCVLARGIEDLDGEMTTHVFRGEFDRNPEKRDLFMQSLKK